MRFSLLLDAYPQEVQWALFNENDQIVEQGGPFPQGDANQEFVFNGRWISVATLLSSLMLTATACTALGLKPVAQTAAFRLKPWKAILL